LAGQSAPTTFDPDPPFRAVLIAAFVPVSIMALVLIVTMKPDPAIAPYPMAPHPEKVRAGRRRNLVDILRGRPVLHIDFLNRWRGRWRLSIIMIMMTIFPAAIDPNPAVISAIPVARHPDGLGSRAVIPMASDPHPVVVVT